jgi:hypothetical protein
MPLKRTPIEILEKWRQKHNPEVVGMRYRDVANLTKRRLGRVVRLATRINDIVAAVIDKHGIGGSGRMDYYSFGRKLWWRLYEVDKCLYDQLIRATKLYFITAYGLKAEVLDEITERLVELADQVKAEEAREFANEQEALEKLLAEEKGDVVAEGGEVGGSQT